MSYDFSGTTGQIKYLESLGTAQLGSGNAMPWTHAFWIKVTPGTLAPNMVDFNISNVFNPGPAWDRGYVGYMGGGAHVGERAFGTGIKSPSGEDSIGSLGLANLDNGSWHHVAFVYGSVTANMLPGCQIYWDGADVTHGIQLGTSNDDYSSNITDFFFGKIGSEATGHKQAEIGIWKRALNATDIGLLYTSKYVPFIVQNADLRHYWSLFSTDTNQGRNDRVNGAHLTHSAIAPSSDAGDHPGPMVTTLGGTLKYQIPTTAPDGTAHKIFIWADATLASMVVTGTAITANGGYFKLTNSGAVIGSARPAMLATFGADETFVATGGACWATGISE